MPYSRISCKRNYLSYTFAVTVAGLNKQASRVKYIPSLLITFTLCEVTQVRIVFLRFCCIDARACKQQSDCFFY